MNPDQYVQDKAASSGSSFYYAFLFLPKERRAAITAFYAFCREVDDVVDEVTDPGVAATKLAWWKSEVHKAFTSQSTHPVMQALMPHTKTFGIEERHLQAVIEGCQMDLDQTRYLDFAGLQRYCHLVAGIVAKSPRASLARRMSAPPNTPTRWARLCNSPTSSATWVRTPCVAASTCPSASCSSST